MKRRWVLWDKKRKRIWSAIYWLTAEEAPSWVTRFILDGRLRYYHSAEDRRKARKRYAVNRRRFVLREVKQIVLKEGSLAIGPLIVEESLR